MQANWIQMWVLIFLCLCGYGCGDIIINPITDPAIDAITDEPTNEPISDPTDAVGNSFRIHGVVLEDEDVTQETILQPVVTPPLHVREPQILPEVPEEPPPPRPPEPPPGVSFADDILPIFTEHCIVCHNVPDAPVGLNLSKRGSEWSAVIKPGNGERSLIVLRTATDIIQPRMPVAGDPLSDAEIQLLIDWIDEGAKDN